MSRIKKNQIKKIQTEKNTNLSLTCILWLLFGGAAMAAMLYVAYSKPIVIMDVEGEQTDISGGEERRGARNRKLLLQENGEAADSIFIPLTKGTKAENVVMENHYMEQELWICLEGVEDGFYEENAVYGDLAPVRDGYCMSRRDAAVLKLKMDGVLEYKSTMENDTLAIVYYEPKELYRLIAVIDPVAGGGDAGARADGVMEKELALETAKLLQKKLEKEDIKLYFTRLEDKQVAPKDRIALAKEVQADLFLSIGVCLDEENPDLYGIQSYYNEAYYIPEFGNVELADAVTRNVTIKAGNRALGLLPAGENSVLREMNIPAAQICLGYLSNEKERALLRQEGYLEKLAEGLADALLEVYTMKNGG